MNSKFTDKLQSVFALTAACLIFSSPLKASVIDVTIDGSDSIWLAGRTDLVIPDANLPWPGGLSRHSGPTPEEIKETLPPGFVVNAGDVIQVADPAQGAISFFNGFGGISYGPEGNGISGSSSLTSFGGISGYLGTQGALVGVFLDDNPPNGIAPSTIDFSNAGIGTDFTSLSPDLAQVFYIGDGLNSTNNFQEFIAPINATRLFLGVSDGFGFNGNPGAYDDNDGSYSIRLGINQTPTSVSEPMSLGLFLIGSMAFFLGTRR